ncbi:DMT family transporter [Sinisalibacter lacisalsi]|uniref:Multidrug DMT transporter n=1 Tax=Sinisalibacter lacisalsi TaxID=1526570 RepID=A0ABQ1QVV1_9RHOB|nr:DMT family transporter [Sinisalibacter lacisalsi]GGD46497.1 multidrug DMT transporter [Sinisalibacter lacisalsi]
MSRYGGAEAVKGHIAMLVFSALVAGSFSFGGVMANEIEPVVLQAMRFGLAAAIVGAAALATGKLRSADFRAPWRYLLLGGAFAIYFVMMFEGLKTAPPVSASAVMTLVPIMTALFAYPILRQRTTPRIALGLAIGAAGALWVIFRGELAALLAFDIGRGEWLYFIGCVAHAFYVPMARKVNRGEAAAASSFLVLSAGALILLVYGWSEIRATDYAALPAIVWIALGYLSIGAMSITFVLLNFASMRLAGAKVMAYTYLTPGWVILWELAFGKGLPGPGILLGVGLTMGAVVLLLKHEV